MGLTKNAIFQAAAGPLAETWVTRYGASKMVITSTGLYALISPPPAGKIRSIDKYGLAVGGANGYTTDGITGVMGSVDARFRINTDDIGYPLIAEPWPNTPEGFFLSESESLILNVTAINSPAVDLFVLSSWSDFDATDVTLIRASFPDMNPVELYAAPPVGKILMPLWAGSTKAYNAQTIVQNTDDISHNFQIQYYDGTRTIIVNNFGISADNYSSFQVPKAIPPGVSVQVVMQEPVNTTTPKMYGGYKFVTAG